MPALRYWLRFRRWCCRSPLVAVTECAAEVGAAFVCFLVFDRFLTPVTARKYVGIALAWVELIVQRQLRPLKGQPGGDMLTRLLRTLEKAVPSGLKTKLPIRAPMIRWIAESSRYSLGVRAAVVFGFALCLRQSEYAQVRGTCRLRRRHLRFVLDKGGRRCIVAVIHGKTDPHNGAERVTGAVPIPAVDPVGLVAELLRTTPGGPDAPVFVHPNGRPVTGAQVSAALKDCARAFGFNPDHYASHSLRIGCASALAEMGKSDSFIATFGRWKSFAFKIYIRRSLEALAAVAPGLFLFSSTPLRR